jgi:cobalt/nickel transport system permease protein
MIQAIAAGDSTSKAGGFWGHLDARVKMICIFSLVLAVVVTPIRFYEAFLGYAVIIVLLGLVSRVRWKYYMLRFIFLIPLLVFLSVSLLVFSEREWSQRALILSGLLVKTFLVFCSSGILALSVGFHELVRGLELLKFPRVFTSMLFFAYRYVFLFYREAGRVLRARKSRSFGRRRGWREWKRAAGVIPFFIFRVLERSERIYAAMLSRGYDGRLPGVMGMRMSGWDYLSGFCFHLVLVLIYVLTVR